MILVFSYFPMPREKTFIIDLFFPSSHLSATVRFLEFFLPPLIFDSPLENFLDRELEMEEKEKQ